MRRLLLLACLALLPGCGVILGYAGAQPLQVSTDPPGAAVFVNEVAHPAVTPCTLELSPQETYFLRVVLGDRKGHRNVHKGLRVGVAVCDGVFTLGLGLLVDYFTGALYGFEPAVGFDLTRRQDLAPAPKAAPCPICGEPRGDTTPCPHCGMR